MFHLSIHPFLSGLVLAVLLTSGVAYATSGVSVSTSASLGRSILTDDQGRTLYRYTPDQAGASTCYEGCAAAWPPVLVDSVPSVAVPGLAQSLGATQRTDGTLQLTYQNQPLYYFIGDSNAGDTNGQASDGVWFVVDGPGS